MVVICDNFRLQLIQISSTSTLSHHGKVDLRLHSVNPFSLHRAALVWVVKRYKDAAQEKGIVIPHQIDDTVI